MNLQFKPVEAKDIERVTPFSHCGPIRRVTVCFWTVLSGGIFTISNALSAMRKQYSF